MSYFRNEKWERKDSNLRRLSQQIYSLSHLTALELSLCIIVPLSR